MAGDACPCGSRKGQGEAATGNVVRFIYSYGVRFARNVDRDGRVRIAVNVPYGSRP